MLKVEGRMELAVLRKHGASIRELARVTGHSRNTVRRYLRGGEAAGARKPATKRAEKLDDFKDYIAGRMRAASPARIPAAVLFREIKERGYRGGVTRVKQFVRTLLPGACGGTDHQVRDRARPADAGGLGDGRPRDGASVGIH